MPSTVSEASVTTQSSSNQLKVVINNNVKNAFGVAIGTGSTDLSKQAVSEYESPQPLENVGREFRWHRVRLSNRRRAVPHW